MWDFGTGAIQCHGPNLVDLFSQMILRDAPTSHFGKMYLVTIFQEMSQLSSDAMVHLAANASMKVGQENVVHQVEFTVGVNLFVFVQS